MTAHFVVTTVVDATPERVFDLSLDIDAHVQSKAASGERAVAGVTTEVIALGEEVTWRARHFGLPFTMTSRITEWDRPTRFIDEQTRGPFRRFRHEHRFEAVSGRTRMVDDIAFDAPMGPLGWFAERVLLEHYLQRLIEQRGLYVKAVAEGRTDGPVRLTPSDAA